MLDGSRVRLKAGLIVLVLLGSLLEFRWVDSAARDVAFGRSAAAEVSYGWKDGAFSRSVRFDTENARVEAPSEIVFRVHAPSLELFCPFGFLPRDGGYELRCALWFFILSLGAALSAARERRVLVCLKWSLVGSVVGAVGGSFDLHLEVLGCAVVGALVALIPSRTRPRGGLVLLSSAYLGSWCERVLRAGTGAWGAPNAAVAICGLLFPLGLLVALEFWVERRSREAALAESGPLPRRIGAQLRLALKGWLLGYLGLLIYAGCWTALCWFRGISPLWLYFAGTAERAQHLAFLNPASGALTLAYLFAFVPLILREGPLPEGPSPREVTYRHQSRQGRGA